MRIYSPSRKLMTKSAEISTESRDSQFYDGDPQALGNSRSIGYLIKVAHRQIVRNIDAELVPFDLTSKQWIPLQVIANGMGNTVASCAAEVGIDGGAMTRMLDRLEAKGLVRRNRSSDDRRVVNVELTGKGKELVEHIPPAICKVLNHHLRGFNASEFETLMSLLVRLMANGEDPLGQDR
jgi:DNA-binding MarR family transcriptional regulator